MKKILLGLIAAGAMTFAFAGSATMYKSPYCGCCDKWAEHMQQAGFSVKTVKTDNMHAVKTARKIPFELGSCHTAVIDGYTFEGHVPAAEIQAFLARKPAGALGLIVPGMPAGSPGMEQGAAENYDVLLLKKDGSTEVFARYVGGKKVKL